MEFIFIILIFGFIWMLISNNKNNNLPSSRAVGESSQPKEDSQARHIRNTLSFAKSQHKALNDKRRQHDAWLHQYGKAKVAELDKLSGVEFEEFLAGLFRQSGYVAELTAASGDYGADLILSKEAERIAVQAKRYVGSVGVQAVQEALSGQAYYGCSSAWVVTTGSYTSNAMELAKKSGVRMIGRSDRGKLMAKLSRDSHDD